ncbi:MAG: hypothetical protein JRN20_07590 [Nitrososphaerota archaeon]|nr:hypothetical protein [Nitrososphaerota archaeon]MDG6924220.1 hypothetical protein [Nitrososphaerota archaeon]
MKSEVGNYSVKLVYLLILVEAITVYFLWALDPITQVGESVFAILLAVDLLSFMMISYIYRTFKSGNQISRGLLIGACGLILVLIYTSLAL